MKIKVIVTEEIRGTNFRGTVYFGGRPFSLGVIFTIPISRLDVEMETRQLTSAEIPDIIQINVSGDDDKPMKLSSEEYGLLFYLVADLCVDLHNNQQAKAVADWHANLSSEVRKILPGCTVTASWTRGADIPDENVPVRFRPVA